MCWGTAGNIVQAVLRADVRQCATENQKDTCADVVSNAALYYAFYQKLSKRPLNGFMPLLLQLRGSQGPVLHIYTGTSNQAAVQVPQLCML